MKKVTLRLDDEAYEKLMEIKDSYCTADKKVSLNEVMNRELPFVLLRKKNELPKVAAIYLVVNKEGDVVYVGSTTNLRSRWNSHHILPRILEVDPENIEDYEIHWLELSDTKFLTHVEAAIINYFDPVLNYGGSNNVYGRGRKAPYKLVVMKVPDALEEKVRFLIAEYKSSLSLDVVSEPSNQFVETEELQKKIQELEAEKLELLQFVQRYSDMLNECINDNAELELKLRQLSKTTR